MYYKYILYIDFFQCIVVNASDQVAFLLGASNSDFLILFTKISNFVWWPHILALTSFVTHACYTTQCKTIHHYVYIYSISESWLSVLNFKSHVATMKQCHSNCQNHEEDRKENFDCRKEAGYFKAYNDRYNIHPTSSFQSGMELNDWW